MPQPHILSVLVQPNTKDDQEKMSIALSKLAQEDPTFKVHVEASTGHTTIAGTGEAQLEMILDRVMREYKVEAEVGQLRVIYRETIRSNSEAEGKYIRQTNGLGEYGHAKIQVSPNESGKGYTFTDDTTGGVVPKEYIQPIDQAIREAMQRGVVAGYEMVDIKVSLYDGSFHDLDSNEMAFKVAGAMAFKAAARKAKPLLLEPVMLVEVSSSESDAAKIIGDLDSRRGRIESMETVRGVQTIKAAVPLSNMFGYATALRGLSQGRAGFLMEFKRYEEAPSGWDLNDEGLFAIPAVPKRPQPGGLHREAMQQEPDID